LQYARSTILAYDDVEFGMGGILATNNAYCFLVWDPVVERLCSFLSLHLPVRLYLRRGG
jgi:hypothetical protein